MTKWLRKELKQQKVVILRVVNKQIKKGKNENYFLASGRNLP